MKEDVKFFSNAEPANFGDGVEGGSSLNHLQLNVVGDVVPFETSDICTECGPHMLFIQCVDVRIMLVKPDLHEIIG